jgi:hypothetical protein
MVALDPSMVLFGESEKLQAIGGADPSVPALDEEFPDLQVGRFVGSGGTFRCRPPSPFDLVAH